VTTLRIAGLQTAGRPGDVDGNLALLERAAAEAAAHGAELLITPEMFLTGYDLGGGLDELTTLAALDLLGPVGEIARRHGLAILLGAPEPAPDGLYNAAFFLDETGRVVGRYRKSHLFGELDDGLFRSGDELFGRVDFRGVRIAFCICYDVEFPETVRAAALDGADLVAVPTAQMTPFAFVAEQLVRTRAWENQVYLAYVNHDGAEANLTYVGRSSIVAPDATVLDAVGHGEALIYATVDPAVVIAAQAENPYLADRRRDLYG
jgi:predicted amidohydrolase